MIQGRAREDRREEAAPPRVRAGIKDEAVRLCRAGDSSIAQVAKDLDRIRAACARCGVSFLELVGSAAHDDFDPSRSDIDVLVDFPDHAPDLFGAYMGLRDDLAEILGRPVDVITLRGVRNPLLLESLRRDAVRLYAA